MIIDFGLQVFWGQLSVVETTWAINEVGYKKMTLMIYTLEKAEQKLFCLYLRLLKIDL